MSHIIIRAVNKNYGIVWIIFMCHDTTMTVDVHARLSDEEGAILRTVARREDRSVSNMVTIYLRRCLQAEGLVVADGVKPRRGRPPKLVQAAAP